MLLQGQRAFITGAGQGNGAAIAKGFAREGAEVIVSDISLATAQATAQAITDDGGTAWVYPLDVTDPQACVDLAETVRANCGAITTLVNNAGIIDRQLIDSPDLRKAWDASMKVNLEGALNVTLAFLPALRETTGCIINMSSIGGIVSTKSSISYSVPKAGLSMFTKDLAQELGPEGIRVNALAPGTIRTPMTKSAIEDPKRSTMYLNSIPLGRFGETHEVVGPAVFLASPQMSGFVTGHQLVVDGGYTTT